MSASTHIEGYNPSQLNEERIECLDKFNLYISKEENAGLLRAPIDKAVDPPRILTINGVRDLKA